MGQEEDEGEVVPLVETFVSVTNQVDHVQGHPAEDKDDHLRKNVKQTKVRINNVLLLRMYDKRNYA